ncbi:hypothetical protein SAMN04488074_13150 [Lentzea albidocapillata subsp. violacea]|uniref:Uncharacterized protein n=1 Tax=Lentzea albidocapillata subsp. violacea TaxID=128104 RepID=A0A1G9XVP8_9PSEU|nr:hypothetical protein [Lentzea albidocapillata]SDN00506.1 hypothetical protein SAMN04488074_13150 [Lentzea albidocapillata subsp. violacea]
MKHTILPDPYWAGMVLGRVVHLHLTLVEPQLIQAHREVENALLATQRVSLATVSRLDATRTADRVFARLLSAVSTSALPDVIGLPEQFRREAFDVSAESTPWPVLIFDEQRVDVVANFRRALTEVRLHGLLPILQLGAGLVGVEPLPSGFRDACTDSAVLLPADLWAASADELSPAVLSGAARSLAMMWAAAEISVYGLGTARASVTALADAFAFGVSAEYRRRAALPEDSAVVELGDPPQDDELPLLSELVRCWWPKPGRAVNIFGSPFDYMTTLEPAHARG